MLHYRLLLSFPLTMCLCVCSWYKLQLQKRLNMPHTHTHEAECSDFMSQFLSLMPCDNVATLSSIYFKLFTKTIRLKVTWIQEF